MMNYREAYTQLEAAARQVALQSYSPYSGFRVGAAVLCASGATYAGANVENASYGLTLCAERVALAMAFSAGEREIVALCVACVDAPNGAALQELMPCGACRQWLQELAVGADIIVAGEARLFRISELLPIPFKLPQSASGGTSFKTKP